MNAEERGAPPHRRYFAVHLALFACWWVLMAIRPLDPKDWALENVLTVPAILFLVATRRAFPLSRISYTLVFTFLALHTLGSHYTYALVPYDAWFRALTGTSLDAALGFSRNMYDRLVHCCFGLLLAYPVRELFLRVAQVRGFWGYYLPLDVTMALSALYELIEWGAAEVFGGDLGVAYLGTQGDVWDAQKDMAAATVGALCAMLITAGLNFWLERDHAREWSESFRVKDPRPYGEDEIRRLWRERRKKT
jgi:putative membrane protein